EIERSPSPRVTAIETRLRAPLAPLGGLVNHADRRSADPLDQIEPGKGAESAQVIVTLVHESADQHQVVPFEGDVPQTLGREPRDAKQRQRFKVPGRVRASDIHIVAELAEKSHPGREDFPVIRTTLYQQTGWQPSSSPLTPEA